MRPETTRGEGGDGAEFGDPGRGGASVGRSRDPESANRRLRSADRTTRQGALPGGRLAETSEWCGDTDRSYVCADRGRPAPLPTEPRCGLLSGFTSGTSQLGQESAADAHQQGRRQPFENPDGTGSPLHSGPVWARL